MLLQPFPPTLCSVTGSDARIPPLQRATTMPTAAELNKLKVEELQKLLKEKGLPATGKKAELVQVGQKSRQQAERCLWIV